MSFQSVRITHADRARHESFLRYVPRVFPRADFRRWYAAGGWTADYEAHGVADGDELVANVSVMRMRLVIDGREVSGAQLGAVGSVPERRGQGLVRPLMERVLAALDREVELVLLYANDSVLDFYPRFGFRRVPEHAFELDAAIEPASDPAPPLALDDLGQRARWLDACARSLPPTERFGAKGYGSIALWHVCNFHRRDVRVLEEGEAYAVAVQRGDTLHLLDLAATRPFDLLAAAPRLVHGPAARIRFGFCPERWCPAARAVGPGEEPLFVRGGPALPAEPFAFPALAHT
jgi:ribosomal protein S18 acetylase RimI-like enzyme